MSVVSPHNHTPILVCAAYSCKRPTSHRFVRKEVVMAPVDVGGMPFQSPATSLVFRCDACGTERRYGMEGR